MPNPKKYNLNFIPSEWNNDSIRNASRIKGELRQKNVISQQDSTTLSKLPYDFFDESIKQSRILGYAKNSNDFLGGEHLPDFLDHEIEIARIIFQNESLDVTSIRARIDNGIIHYRVVDEYDTLFTFTPQSTKLIPSLNELIQLINSLRSVDEPNKQMTNGFYYFKDISWAESKEEIRDFIEIRSLFYPELYDWFKDEAQETMEIQKQIPS